MAAATSANVSTTVATTPAVPISFVSHHQLQVSAPQPTHVSAGISFMTNPITTGVLMPQQPPPPSIEALPLPLRPQAPPFTAAGVGVSFSSDSASSSSDYDDMEEDDDDETQATPSATLASSADRKRKRESLSKRGRDSSSMMEFFEVLMRQVMQKQEALQQKFFEAVEKREQDRMIREEAWRRQEIARVAREHEIIAQERAMSASRDAAIISFLQKITGQTIHLPSHVIAPAAPPPSVFVPPPAPPAAAAPVSISPSSVSMPPPPPPQSQQQQHHQQQQQRLQQLQQLSLHDQVHQQHQPQAIHAQIQHQQPISSEILVAVAEQQVPQRQEITEVGSSEASSSRWPKEEILALIELRSGLEPRYQEAGPKGPLWEEISAAMQRIGYKRNAKRCKEKWENINKYYKKVKESNKRRPEDAKTCPYFHQLDALYRKKILGGSPGIGVSGGAVGGNSGIAAVQNTQEPPQQPHHHQSVMVHPTPAANLLERSTSVVTITSSSQPTPSDNQPGGTSSLQTGGGVLTVQLFGEGVNSATAETTVKKPEDTVREQAHQLVAMDCDKTTEELDMYEEEEEEDDDEDEYDDDDDLDDKEDEMKMSYKIDFQRQSAGSSNGEGNGATSFLAMVQ